MKKFFVILAAVALSVACALGVAGCKKDGRLKVYVPDGAPALSVATLDNSDKFSVRVISANEINAKVSGDKPAADIAVMPVNAAVKLLGGGENYQMLGTVTHGNLFLLKRGAGEDVSTAAQLGGLVGKTVGVINLANVPGLTFKVILNDNGIPFNQLNDGASVAADKVNLKNVTAQEASPVTADCDYFVVPEPAATTKIKATEGKLSLAGSLQTLYGGESGYPQAVAVAKKSVIEKRGEDIAEFMASFSATKNWLQNESTTAEQIVSAIDKMTEGDLSHTFTAANLSKPVIANCGINFVAATDCKAEVTAYIQKLNAVSNGAWGTPADGFFLN